MTQDKQILLLYGNKLYIARAIFNNYIKLLIKQEERIMKKYSPKNDGPYDTGTG